MKEEDKKVCFVIMPISDADGYEKGHFTRVYEHLIKPAVIEAGFEPIRADDTSKANFIVVDILQQILACEMAICDLSSRNPNVFYELGIRQAFNKKTVLIKDSKTLMPFDIAGIRTLPYSENLRVDEVKKDIPNLVKCISETYEADVKEVNSLLQLLSIEQPATLPNKVTLSQDSSMILNAINDLNKRIDIMTKHTADVRIIVGDEDSILLPSGSFAEIGTEIYDESDYSTSLGRLVSASSKYILLRNHNNRIIRINKASKEGMSLRTLSF